MIDDVAAYAGLFAAALIAATILPMQSEAALVGCCCPAIRRGRC